MMHEPGPQTYTLLAQLVTPANEQECAQVTELAEQVQDATTASVAVAFVDQSYTGEQAAQDAAQGIRLEVVKSPSLNASTACARAGNRGAFDVQNAHSARAMT
jgi:hypothetical protein